MYPLFIPFSWSKKSAIHYIVRVKKIVHHHSFISLQSPMSYYSRTCENITERVNIMGMLVDEIEYPIYQLGLTTYIPTTL